MSEYDDDENYVSGDFFSLVGHAQLGELVEVERQREKEREAIKALAEKQKTSGMTLMQIAGLRSKKELDAVAQEKSSAEDKRLLDEDAKRKEAERAKLVNQFPPPDLKHS